ncbi:MerR family transcriptional regulator [Micromonospora sp. NPDC047670]|uniref:MerR family transcriptional regulator n=1 Tax=Micromonospora sp. NPDC047670 TaxID=3364252 RepID=UPI00371076B9
MGTTFAPEFPLTVRDVAEDSGVAPSAVRFYETHRVVTAYRTAGNQRRFDNSAACRIRVAKVAQRIGLSVREIAEVFNELPPDPQSDDWAKVARILIDESERRIAALKAELASLQSGEKLCKLSAPPAHTA